MPEGNRNKSRSATGPWRGGPLRSGAARFFSSAELSDSTALYSTSAIQCDTGSWWPPSAFSNSSMLQAAASTRSCWSFLQSSSLITVTALLQMILLPGGGVLERFARTWKQTETKLRSKHFNLFLYTSIPQPKTYQLISNYHTLHHTHPFSSHTN